MATATHKIAKASGGCYHYAQITVCAESGNDESTVALSPDVFAWLKEDYGPDAWQWPVCEAYRAAAIAGASYAIKNIKEQTHRNGYRVEVTKIHASPADTSWDSVALAACLAVWDALGVEGDNVPYWEGRNVRFPAGT